MIVVDTSAIVVIVFNEPERDTFLRAILSSGGGLVSTVSVVETRMVVHACRGERAVLLLDDMLRLPVFEQIAPDHVQAATAHSAFIALDKGSGHGAGLNFGDIFSYALAKVRQLPLLFKGADFGRTDIMIAAD